MPHPLLGPPPERVPCTCPYTPGDDDQCPLHGERARYEKWMAKAPPPAPTPPPAGQRFDFNFDPKGNGFTREQFMAQADDMIDKYIDKIQRDPVSTPTLANAVLAVHADNWHELVAVFFATALQRLAYMSERPEHRAR